MEKQNPSSWAELDSDEIASIASEDLYENRPNRWHGPKSTWRALTEEERTLWQSMKRIGDQDLSVHLYNTFALKRSGRDPATAQDLTVQTEDGQEAVWAPPRLWTAWPLAEGRLPTEGLVARQEDGDEEFTFRKDETKMPSSDLRDELSATMLRIARKKFHRRQKRWAAARPSVEDHVSSPAGEEGQTSDSEAQSGGTSPSGSRATSANPQSDDDGQGMKMDDQKGVDDDDLGPTTPSKRGGVQTSTRTYEPTASTNDELSYKLLEAPSRHILSQLDSTLRILHHTRALGQEDDSDSSTGGEESDTQQNAEQKRPRGRPRNEERDEKRLKTTKRGRPRKTPVPLEGESHEDMLVRVARQGHRRLPTQTPEAETRAGNVLEKEQESDVNTQPGADSANGERGRADDGFEAWLRAGDGTQTRRGAKVWGLRDWSDVIGAASLAGFSPDVIARTTKRCADLFGESMTIRNLQEVPASTGTGVRAVDYCPEPIHLSASDADTDDLPSSSSEDEVASLAHRRIASRQSSQTPFSQATPSPSPSRSRSRSASVGQQHFCPVATCSRAASGFSRRANLKRHMSLVHGGMSPGHASTTPGGGAAPSELDSEDEVLGAVHVDGFLRAVVPSRGWRGEDMATRKRKKHWGEKKVRGRGGESEGTSDEGAVDS